MNEEENKIRDLLNSGGELIGPSIGGAIGGVLGFIAGGPVGAAGAGVVGNITGKLLSDVANRHLSKREEARVGATAVFAISKIQERLEQGHQLRNDSFFEEEAMDRSQAEELFEGVLLKAKNVHEEKKTKYIANIFTNTSFDSGFSVGEANHLLKLAQGFTYKQICLLALLGNKFAHLRTRNYQQGRVPFETYSILLQLIELYNLGLVFCRNDTDSGNVALLGPGEIVPNRIFLTEIARRHYHIMGLEEVPREDILEEVVRSLT